MRDYVVSSLLAFKGFHNPLKTRNFSFVLTKYHWMMRISSCGSGMVVLVTAEQN